jgi:hypothetical protein
MSVIQDFLEPVSLEMGDEGQAKLKATVLVVGAGG